MDAETNEKCELCHNMRAKVKFLGTFTKMILVLSFIITIHVYVSVHKSDSFLIITISKGSRQVN